MSSFEAKEETNYFVREDDWSQPFPVNFAIRGDDRVSEICEHLVVAICTLFVSQVAQMIAGNYLSSDIFQTIANTSFAAGYSSG